MEDGCGLSEDEDNASTASTFSSISSVSSFSSFSCAVLSPNSAVSRVSSPTYSTPTSPELLFAHHTISPPRRHRRLALCAPSSAVLDEDDRHSSLFRHFSLSLAVPSPQHKHFLLSGLLSSHPFFLLLSKRARCEVWDEMTREMYNRGGWIVRKGGECDKFYVVESGEVRWDSATTGGSVNDGGGGKGTTFGDLSLYHPSVTPHSVEAASERVTVWCVEGSVVRHLLSTAARNKHVQLNSWLASLVVAADDGESGERLSEDEMAVLLDRCELVRYEEGEWIVPSALSRDHVFIVREGHVVAQRKTGESTALELANVRQRTIHPCAVDEQMPLDAGAGGIKQPFGVGAVFAADNVLCPAVSPTLPRRPSPIPMPAPSALSSTSLPSVPPRRKRGRDDSSSLSSSSLSTIYEHAEVDRNQPSGQRQESQDSQECEAVDEDSGARKQQRRQSTTACTQLTRCESSNSLTAITPTQSLPPPLLTVSPSTLTRASSSPAIIPTSTSIGGLWVVCGSRECSIVGVPLDVLTLDGMERVRRWVVSRLVQ